MNSSERVPRPRASAGRLADLERLCFAEPWDLSTLTALLANPAVGAWTEGEDSPPSAYLLFQCAGGEAEILRIGVIPEQRRSGVAGQLLSRWQEWAREAGMERAVLEVREGNAAARALYHAAGFRLVGRRKGYYRQPNEDALLFEWRPGPQV